MEKQLLAGLQWGKKEDEPRVSQKGKEKKTGEAQGGERVM